MALANWCPGGIVFKDFSKSEKSFRMGLAHLIRVFKQLSNDPGPVFGYAFSAEKDLPIYSVMCTIFSGKRPLVKSNSCLGEPARGARTLTVVFAPNDRGIEY